MQNIYDPAFVFFTLTFLYVNTHNIFSSICCFLLLKILNCYTVVPRGSHGNNRFFVNWTQYSRLNHLRLALPTFHKMQKHLFLNPDCDYQSLLMHSSWNSYVSNKDVFKNAKKLWREITNDKNKVFFHFSCLTNVNKYICLELDQEKFLNM